MKDNTDGGAGVHQVGGAGKFSIALGGLLEYMAPTTPQIASFHATCRGDCRSGHFLRGPSGRNTGQKTSTRLEGDGVTVLLWLP